jgi:hypothetical protein|nr:MAG TPA: hypothetical protein [Caudoviricetes sp.]
MDIDKLIEAVRLCGSSPTIYQCEACAYYTGGDMGACIPEMTAQAADALSALRGELEQVKRQRDAAVADIEGLLDRVEQIRQGYGIEDETADNKLATLCEEYCTGTGTNCYKPGRRYECKSFCWRGLKEA